jgi:hypothetical protein
MRQPEVHTHGGRQLSVTHHRALDARGDSAIASPGGAAMNGGAWSRDFVESPVPVPIGCTQQPRIQTTTAHPGMLAQALQIGTPGADHRRVP